MKKTGAISAAGSDSKVICGVKWIEPIDFNSPEVRDALDRTRQALTHSNLKGILEVRTEVARYLTDRLIEAGYVHPPVYMMSGCTDPLNHFTYPARINYYGSDVSVTQSLIFQKILMVMLSPADKVFWASPNIRMEMKSNGKEYKYTSEFTQVDFERRGGTYEELIQMIASLVGGLYRSLNQRLGATIEAIRGERLPELREKLPVYDVAEIREKYGLENDDAVERWGSERSGGSPFIVVNLKREAYDCYDPEKERFLNYDLVIPPFGDNPNPVECLSGAERTRTIPDLKQRMIDLDYPMSYFDPFFELFSALDRTGGQIRCAGGGFGIERLTYSILGLKDIHSVYPFPRASERPIVI